MRGPLLKIVKRLNETNGVEWIEIEKYDKLSGTEGVFGNVMCISRF